MLDGGFRPTNMKLKLYISGSSPDYDMSEDMKELTFKEEK